jgi:hypothetical protein
MPVPLAKLGGRGTLSPDRRQELDSTSEAKPRPDQPDVRVYIGTLVKEGDAYVLKTGNEKYLLDSQKKAKNYKGKDVKITGTLDKTKNMLHVEKIEVSPSL